MTLEDIVDGLVDEYESQRSRRNSRLYKVAEAFIEFTKPQSTLQGLWDEFAGVLGSLFLKGHTPQRSMFEYLAKRVPDLQPGGLHSDLYREIKPEIVADELIILFYLGGWLPRIVDGKKVKLDSPASLELMSIGTAKLGSRKKEEREDQRFYRTVMRVSQRRHRRLGPSWSMLVNHVLQFMPDSTRYRPVKSFEDFMESRYALDSYVVERIRRYLVGEVPVMTSQGSARVFPLKNLELLRRGEIERGSDRTLKDLLSEGRYNHKHGGMSWAEYQDLAGKLKDVIAYHGMALNNRVISGQPNESDDYRLLKAAVLGQIPVTYRGRKRRMQSRDDICMALGFKETFRKDSSCAEELIPVFRRAKTRCEKQKGRSPTQLMNAVLADRAVVERYGHLTTPDVYRLWVVRQFKEYLRPRVLGKMPLTYNGAKTWIRPEENLSVLRPESKSLDDSLRRFHSQLRWHKRALGLGYWDIVEEVFAEKRAVDYHGRALTRQDISPRAVGRAA